MNLIIYLLIKRNKNPGLVLAVYQLPKHDHLEKAGIYNVWLFTKIVIIKGEAALRGSFATTKWSRSNPSLSTILVRKSVNPVG